MAENTFLDEFLSDTARKSAEALRESASLLEMERGQFVFFESDESTDMYIVESGFIEANYVHADGKVYVFHFLFPGEAFGGFSLYDREICPYSAVVRKDAAVWRLPSEEIERLIKSDIGLLRTLHDTLGKKLYSCYMKARCIAGERVEKRVACILLKAMNEQGMQLNCVGKIAPELTNRDISGLIGSTEETVSRIMSRLKKQGIIKTDNRHIVVLEPQALRDLIHSD